MMSASPARPDAAHVLVVDDDPLNRSILAISLERDGHRVSQSENGRVALDVLARADVDVVLMDIEMPVMDGYAVLRHRHDAPDLRSIPFIVISAVDDMASVVACVELGAEDYLAKPFDPVLLKARLGACLEMKRLRDHERVLLATVTAQAERLEEWNRELAVRVEEKVHEVEQLSRLRGFVSPQIAEMIVSGGEEALRSHRRDITVLFSDFRGFTAFAETSEPEDVIGVLSEFHAAVGPLVFEHHGTLSQFAGDGMMVFFNDPVPVDQPALAAVRLGVAMRACAEELRTHWQALGHDLTLGVGIASGFATCGRIGFDGRFEYTVMGTVVNLAARLCGAAAGGQVLITNRVLAATQPLVDAVSIGELDLKGLTRPVPAYDVRSA